MKIRISFIAILLLVSTGVWAQVPTIVNGSFEDDVLASGANQNTIGSWYHRTAYCWVKEETASGLPLTPYGRNWVEFGNQSWVYQQIGTWNGEMLLNISLLVGSIAGRDFPGLHVSLWVGGDPAAAASGNPAIPATTLDSVGATQIAVSDLIQPEALTAGTSETSEVSVNLSTGSGYTPDEPLWLLVQAAGRQRVLIDNIVIGLATGDPTPVDPTPAMDTEGVDLAGTLSWDVANATNPTFAVNLGTTEACDDILVGQNTGGAMEYTIPEGELDYGQSYYWRVDVTDNGTAYTGQVWHFTTEFFAYPVEGVVATSNATWAEGQGPANAVNGSGLDDDDQHSTSVTDMWLGTADPNESPYIQFELDRIYELNEMLVWNHNLDFESSLGLGIKEATIEYSQDGVDWTVLGDVELPQAPGVSTYTHGTAIAMQGVGAKYVRLTAHSNYGGGDQYGLSEVRFTYIPAYARDPEPADGATEVDPGTALSWRAGRDALSHEVYLGTDPNALTLAGTADEGGFAPALDLDTTYYWRVDEVAADAMWPGDTWTFSTQEIVEIDDFESYIDDAEAGDVIWEVWIDGWVEEGGDPDNGGSVVGNSNSPFAEQTIVYGGGQSMPLFFSNTDGQVHAQATRTFEVAQNWAAHGIKLLGLHVYGDVDNVGGQLYVKIDETKVYFESVSNVLKLAQWMFWPIDLTEVDADLSNVTSLSVGIDGAGAAGVLYVDDIYLSAGTVALVDPVTPDDSDPNLAAYYPFEGNADDSLSNYPGTITGSPEFVSGVTGQAIQLDEVATSVVYDLPADEIWPAYSLSLWAKTDSFGQDLWSGLFNNNADANDFQIDVDGTDPGNYRYGGTGSQLLGPVTADWVHLGVSCDGQTTALYYNGLYVARLDAADTQFGQIAFGINRAMANRWGGILDEARLYNRSLSAAEIAGLAGMTEPVWTVSH